MDKTVKKLEFEAGKDIKKYKVEAICNNAIYTNKAKARLPGFHYLVA